MNCDADALAFIVARRLDLKGLNPDPFGLGGGGGTQYSFTVTNDSHKQYPGVEANEFIRVKGDGPTLLAAVKSFQETADKISQSIAEDRERKENYLHTLAGQ
jgi:hypothetical protein